MGFHTRRVQHKAVGLQYIPCRLQFLRSEHPWLSVYRGTVESGTGRDVMAVATTLRSLLIGLTEEYLLQGWPRQQRGRGIFA